MILYNVWFSYKDGIDDQVELPKLTRFLDDLKSRSKIHSYRLMKNTGSKPKTRLSKYQITIEFADGTQFKLPFAEVSQIGIHSGHHGSMIENVSDFMVEVFEDV